MSYILSTAAVSFASLGVSLGYLQYVDYDPPYSVLSPESQYAEFIHPKTLSVVRDFRIHRTVELRIERSVIQAEDIYTEPLQVRTLVHVPDSHVTFFPGTYRLRNIYEIPYLPDGTYVLANRVCWRANLLRDDCLNLPPLSFHSYKEPYNGSP